MTTFCLFLLGFFCWVGELAHIRKVINTTISGFKLPQPSRSPWGHRVSCPRHHQSQRFRFLPLLCWLCCNPAFCLTVFSYPNCISLPLSSLSVIPRCCWFWAQSKHTWAGPFLLVAAPGTRVMQRPLTYRYCSWELLIKIAAKNPEVKWDLVWHIFANNILSIITSLQINVNVNKKGCCNKKPGYSWLL